MDDLPPEAVDNLIKAFDHHAGLSAHPGKYRGPEVKDPFNQTNDTRCAKELVTPNHWVVGSIPTRCKALT